MAEPGGGDTYYKQGCPLVLLCLHNTGYIFSFYGSYKNVTILWLKYNKYRLDVLLLEIEKTENVFMKKYWVSRNITFNKYIVFNKLGERPINLNLAQHMASLPVTALHFLSLSTPINDGIDIRNWIETKSSTG